MKLPRGGVVALTLITMNANKVQCENLKCVLKEVKVSETVETSLQLSLTSVADVTSLQALTESNGQTAVTLFLRNMADRLEEVTPLIGDECQVLHFKATVLDLTDGAHKLVFTDGYDNGLSALTWNTANLNTTKEDALAVLLSQLDARIDDGTYWWDSDDDVNEPEEETEEPEEEPKEEKKPQRPNRPQRPNKR